MPSSQHYAFDGGCIGRPKEIVERVRSAYMRLESALAPHHLHNFNFSGYDSLYAAGLAGDQSLEVLRAWRGIPDFACRTASLFGCADSDALVAYGKTTIEHFKLVLDACKGHRVLWTDDFYHPWDIVMADADASQSIEGHRIALRSLISGQGTEAAVRRLVDAIGRIEPTVVVLSVVTQGGIRIPIERCVERLLEEPVRSRGSLPLFVLDGCQSFGRIETDLASVPLRDVPCAYVGCFHKTMRGPKGMGFLVCNDLAWRRTFDKLRNDGRDSPDLAQYGRSGGRHHAMPTHAVDRVVGAAAVLNGLDRETLRSGIFRIRMNQSHLVIGLSNTAWELVTPDHLDWQSGIVLVRPPAMLRGNSNVHAMKQFLDDAAAGGIAIDELRGMIRIAFDADHDEGEGERLAERLVQAVAGLE